MTTICQYKEKGVKCKRKAVAAINVNSILQQFCNTHLQLVRTVQHNENNKNGNNDDQ